jgi:hypothetical protein
MIRKCNQTFVLENELLIDTAYCKSIRHFSISWTGEILSTVEILGSTFVLSGKSLSSISLESKWIICVFGFITPVEV